MASTGSALANVLKKSLTIDYSLMSTEILGWNDAAKKLREKYNELIAIHERIQLEDDWVELAGDYDALTKEMQELENTKIGTSDKERNGYSRDVAQLILRANKLLKKAEAEPERRARATQLEVEYAETFRKIGGENGLLAEMEKLQLQESQAYKSLKGSKDWTGASENRMAQLKKQVPEAEEAIKLEKARRRAEEEKQERLRATQEKERRVQEELSLKSAQKESERKERIAQIKPLLVRAKEEAIKVGQQYASLKENIAKLEVKLVDNKYSAFREGLDKLKKEIKNRLDQDLSNREYKAFAAEPGFDGLSNALQQVNASIDGVRVEQAETLKRDLDKVLAKMHDLAGDHTDYEDSLQDWDPELIEKKAANRKVRGYVYTPDLQTAKGYLRDVVGVLGKERQGRTGPNRNVNHIHVLGSPQFNALFDRGGTGGAVRLLGFVNGHMDREASASVLSEAAKVEGRANGANFTEVEVDLVDRTLVEVEV
jgi:DNA repair exonuclease SbcCD ATPase subunit